MKTELIFVNIWNLAAGTLNTLRLHKVHETLDMIMPQSKIIIGITDAIMMLVIIAGKSIERLKAICKDSRALVNSSLDYQHPFIHRSGSNDLCIGLPVSLNRECRSSCYLPAISGHEYGTVPAKYNIIANPLKTPCFLY